MDLKTLKEKHPDLVAAIVEEAKAEMEPKLAEAKEQGSTGERERIQGVLDQKVPGHEDLVDALAFDGKTTPAEAAVKVIQAAKESQGKALDAFTSGSSEPDNPSDPDSDHGKTPEEKARAKWDKDPKIRADFIEFETYFAYVSDAESPVFGKIKDKRGE